MVKFSLDDDADDDDEDEEGDDDSRRRPLRLRHRRPRSSGPMTSEEGTTSMNGAIKIETLDDYDVQQSFEAMDRHKLQVLAPAVAYQIILALGYLGHGNHHSDRDKFTFSKFQDEVMKRHTVVVAGRNQQHQQQQNIDSSIEREYEEEIVTLPMLLDIIKKNSDVLRRDRSENIEYTFDNAFDQDKKGYLTASDLQRIALEVDGEEGAMSDEEAEVMARLTSTTTRTSGAKSHQTSGTGGHDDDEGAARVSLTDFRRLFAPPSP